MKEPVTIRGIAERTGQNAETLARRLRRAGFRGVSIDAALTDEQVEKLFEAGRPSAGQKRRTPKSVLNTPIVRAGKVADKSTDTDADNKSQADTDTRTQADTSGGQKSTSVRLSFDGVASAVASASLLSVVFGHGLLIVFELLELAGTIGFFAGAVVLSVIVACVALSSSKKWEETSSTALLVAFWLDAASTYLHYRAFEPHVGSGLSIGLAVIVSMSAYMGLYLFRSKNNQWEI